MYNRFITSVLVGALLVLFTSVDETFSQATPDPSAVVDRLVSDEGGNSDGEVVACGAPCAPGLAKLLETGSLPVRVHAAWVLAKMGPAGAAAVPALAATLKSGEPILRTNSARALGGGHVVHLPNNWGSNFGVVMKALVFSTQGIHANPQVSVPALVAALKDTDRDVRSSAAQALAVFKASTVATAAAKAALAEALVDKESIEVRVWAALSLVLRGEKTALDTLITVLRTGESSPTSTGKENSSDNRVFAAFALGELGVAARSAVPALESATVDTNQQVAQVAKAALAKIANAR